MKNGLFLGLDTSCYTSSAVLVNEAGQIVGQAKRLLTVKSGRRGLSQSEMVFQHVRNLPEVFAEAQKQAGSGTLKAVGASVQPRRLSDSYMPVFLVSKGFGQVLAEANHIPFYDLSHQENHIWAGLHTASGPKAKSFLAVHMSGGTTELLKVDREDSHLAIQLLGGTSDISAGQLIDRTGVKLGLPFPAGPALEELAANMKESALKLMLPISLRQGKVSFAGPETQVQRWLSQGHLSAEIALAVQKGVARAIGKLIEFGREQSGLNHVLLVGGVASNQFIGQYLQNRFEKQGCLIYKATLHYSSDHALGCAVRAWQGEQEKKSQPIFSEHKL